MPKTVNYHLVHASTGTVANAASAQILRSGRIVGIKGAIVGVAGGGNATVVGTVELNNPSQASGDTNNPARELILASHTIFMGSGSASATVGSGPMPFVPLSVPVQPGDTLCANQVVVGTSPATERTYWDVLVLEN